MTEEDFVKLFAKSEGASPADRWGKNTLGGESMPGLSQGREEVNVAGAEVKGIMLSRTEKACGSFQSFMVGVAL